MFRTRFRDYPQQAPPRRVSLGLARTGTTGSHTSGDIFLAVSTGNPGAFTAGGPPGGGAEGYDTLTFVRWNNINPFFAAVVQATEEAVANALIANEDMTGRDGRRAPALPRHRLARLLAEGRGEGIAEAAAAETVGDGGGSSPSAS